MSANPQWSRVKRRNNTTGQDEYVAEAPKSGDFIESSAGATMDTPVDATTSRTREPRQQTATDTAQSLVNMGEIRGINTTTYGAGLKGAQATEMLQRRSERMAATQERQGVADDAFSAKVSANGGRRPIGARELDGRASSIDREKYIASMTSPDSGASTQAAANADAFQRAKRSHASHALAKTAPASVAMNDAQRVSAAESIASDMAKNGRKGSVSLRVNGDGTSSNERGKIKGSSDGSKYDLTNWRTTNTNNKNVSGGNLPADGVGMRGTDRALAQRLTEPVFKRATRELLGVRPKKMTGASVEQQPPTATQSKPPTPSQTNQEEEAPSTTGNGAVTGAAAAVVAKNLPTAARKPGPMPVSPTGKVTGTPTGNRSGVTVDEVNKEIAKNKGTAPKSDAFQRWEKRALKGELGDKARSVAAKANPAYLDTNVRVPTVAPKGTDVFKGIGSRPMNETVQNFRNAVAKGAEASKQRITGAGQSIARGGNVTVGEVAAGAKNNVVNAGKQVVQTAKEIPGMTPKQVVSGAVTAGKNVAGAVVKNAGSIVKGGVVGAATNIAAEAVIPKAQEGESYWGDVANEVRSLGIDTASGAAGGSTVGLAGAVPGAVVGAGINVAGKTVKTVRAIAEGREVAKELNQSTDTGSRQAVQAAALRERAIRAAKKQGFATLEEYNAARRAGKAKDPEEPLPAELKDPFVRKTPTKLKPGKRVKG